MNGDGGSVGDCGVDDGGVGKGGEPQGAPIAVDGVGAEGADSDVVGGVGFKVAEEEWGVEDGEGGAAAEGEALEAILYRETVDGVGDAPIQQGLVDVGHGREACDVGAGVGCRPQHQVVQTEVGALLAVTAGRGEEEDDERVGLQVAQRHVFRLEGGVEVGVGQREVHAATHDVALVGGAVVACAQQQHAPVVASDGRVVFVAAREPARPEVTEGEAAGDVFVDVGREECGQHGEEVARTGHEAIEEGDERVDVDGTGREDGGDDLLGERGVEVVAGKGEHGGVDDVVKHEGLQPHRLVAVGHRSCFLAGFDEGDGGVDVDIHPHVGDGLVDGIGGVIPDARGGEGVVDRYGHEYYRHAVAGVVAPLLEAAVGHGHGYLGAKARENKAQKEKGNAFFHIAFSFL